jgi:hypothetical protein
LYLGNPIMKFLYLLSIASALPTPAPKPQDTLPVGFLLGVGGAFVAATGLSFTALHRNLKAKRKAKEEAKQHSVSATTTTTVATNTTTATAQKKTKATKTAVPATP